MFFSIQYINWTKIIVKCEIYDKINSNQHSKENNNSNLVISLTKMENNTKNSDDGDAYIESKYLFTYDKNNNNNYSFQQFFVSRVRYQWLEHLMIIYKAKICQNSNIKKICRWRHIKIKNIFTSHFFDKFS
jgi:hypothetical protein